MAVNQTLQSAKSGAVNVWKRISNHFIEKTHLSEKRELNFQAFKYMAISFVFLFLIVVFLMPEVQPIEFTQKLDTVEEPKEKFRSLPGDNGTSGRAQALWAPPRMSVPVRRNTGGPEINYNTSMILGAGNGNAKTQ